MPSSPNYKRNYKREDAIETPERKKFRADRDKARRMAEAFYGEAAIKNKYIYHKIPLDQGGSTDFSNLRIRSPHANRSYPRTKTGQMKRGANN